MIDDILEDGSCTVTFSEYGNTEVTQVKPEYCCTLVMKYKGIASTPWEDEICNGVECLSNYCFWF